MVFTLEDTFGMPSSGKTLFFNRKHLPTASPWLGIVLFLMFIPKSFAFAKDSPPLASTTPLGSLSSSANADETLLLRARQAAQTGDAGKAVRLYQQITFKSHLFGKKLEDLTLWHLSLEKPPAKPGDSTSDFFHSAEALKLMAIAERLGISWDKQKDHKALAALTLGLCTIDWPVENPQWQALMRAYFIRYAHLFRKSRSMGDPTEQASRGRRISLQTLSLQPYLREIALMDGYSSLTYLAGRGCSLWEDDFDQLVRDTKEQNHQEFLALKRWWINLSKDASSFEDRSQKHPGGNPQRLGAQPPEGSEDVMVRLLGFALEKVDKNEHVTPSKKTSMHNESVNKAPVRDEALAEELLQLLHPLKPQTSKDSTAWQLTSDEESRYLFQKLIDAEKISPPPYGPSAPLFNAIMSRISASKDPMEGMRWLSLLKTSSLDKTNRTLLTKTLDHLLSQKPQSNGSPESDEGRGCLLLNRAKIAFYQGDIPLALTLLRRILIGEETSSEGEITQKAESLAATIIDEYRYDNAILGMIHTLFPRSLWGKLFVNLAIEHSLRGEAREFDRVLALIEETRTHQSSFMHPPEKNLLGALARRNPNAMKEAWDLLVKENLRGAMRFCLKLGERALSLKTHERKGIEPYLQIILKTLTDLRQKGSSSNQVDQIIQLLAPSGPPSGRYDEGRTTVLGSTVHAGVARLKDDTNLENCPNTWNAPRSLAPRPFLPRPKKVGLKDWEIR